MHGIDFSAIVPLFFEVCSPMHMLTRLAHRAVTAAGLCIALAAASQELPAPKDEPYLGPITLQVDATDIDHKVFRVRETLPVRPGRLTLLYPQWLPGHHGPTGDTQLLAGLRMKAGSQTLAWLRDTLEPQAFHVDVPAGVSSLELEFQYLSPASQETGGRVVATREMLGVQWNAMVLYPAGHQVSRIAVQPSLRLPAHWQSASALRADDGALAAAADAQGWLRYQTVSLETLVDSPVFAGRHFKRVTLDATGHRRPVSLNLMGDDEAQIAASEEQLQAHRKLVQQADRLFGARHYAHYDFLLAISNTFGGIGLEHHESSENGVKADYFKDWPKGVLARELLPHEYVHSWNGKFRRPRDLWTANFNQPMQNSLLWVYEGQTQYWGRVLAARSGLVTAEQERDSLARAAASMEQRAGRAWRSLQDTTNEAIITPHQWNRDWRSWQRSADYYDESALIWLEADARIRELSKGKRSLDDFARGFFGVADGRVEPLLYGFDDVVHALEAVQPHDWARFLRERLDAVGTSAPLEGLTRAGWKLVYDDKPSEFFKTEETEHKHTDLTYSLGVQIDEKEGKLSSVQWDSPAYRAGLAPGVTIVAVNMLAYKADALKNAITAAKDGGSPIELLVKDGDNYRIVRVDYRGGLRYPKLERLPNTEDRLNAILTAR